MNMIPYVNRPAPFAWDVAAAIFGATGLGGGLYDPSALDTLFQDANGTTPALPGDPVRLVLDARQELGPELSDVLTQSLVLATGTRSGNGWNITTTSVSTAGVRQPGTWQTGKLYRYSVAWSGNANGRTIRFAIAGNVIVLGNGESGNVAGVVPAGASGNVDLYSTSSVGDTFYFEIGSIKEVINPPLSQPTAAARPTLLDVSGNLGLRFDLVDDALTTVLPQAITGDILIAGTGGTIIEPFSGDTLTIGPTTYTGGTPGLFHALGDIVGMVLIDRTLSATERRLLVAYYKGKGAKGLLVEGPEKIVNGDFSDGLDGWSVTSEGTGSVSVSDGRAIITSTNGSNYGAITQSVPIEEGSTYLLSFDNSGPTGSYVQFTNVTSFNGPIGTTRTVRRAAATGNSPFLLRVAGNSGTVSFDNISFRELRAQEDWT